MTQIKSKERVQRHGEVFTAQHEVTAMLDLVRKEAKRIDSTFLEPACGNGAFLAEILRRKLNTVFRMAGMNDADCEYWATRAFSTIYGIDIMADNIAEARERLFNDFFARFLNRYKHQPTHICMDSIRFILSQNIQQADSLTCKTGGGTDLIMTSWVFDENDGLTIGLFRYADMVRSGCSCKPLRVLPKIPYMMLPAIFRSDECWTWQTSHGRII